MPTRTKRTYKTEREFWRLLHASTKAAALRRAAADRDLERIFNGRRESLKDFFEYLYEQFRKGSTRSTASNMEQFHPDAIPLILEHGIDYTPTTFEEWTYREKLQPLSGKCFFNSYFLMEESWERAIGDDPTLAYVEGVVMGAVVRPMLHAWNAIEGTTVGWDWSHYATTGWSCYFGVPFTYTEHQYIMQTAYDEQDCRSLFDRENFEEHRVPLMEVLARRKVQEREPAT
jgi:hypothetical protein